ncbi:MAG TPA: rhodanese-like domain-containing protein [Casimicrobiaceae bacterium]|jgi:rhodanese-related sulfurtransferase|nr:rhodanese-like domain-containing protein [Casimicrobiaceae bacterium]HWD34688.1 rhodanese-like domain-containing protein [Casimicrobiaceae bacterium]
MPSKEINLQELNARLHSATPPTLLEALPAKYYRDWHLPGARPMPHDEVRALAPTLVPDKRTPIVVYCASATCRNSHIAASVLGQLGYTDVAVFAGGKQAWSEAGLPVERGIEQVA